MCVEFIIITNVVFQKIRLLVAQANFVETAGILHSYTLSVAACWNVVKFARGLQNHLMMMFWLCI